jgi:hypothetical protein
MQENEENIRTGSKRNSLKPRTFFDELAEYGFLLDFLKTRLTEKFNKDPEFRDDMYEILYKYSNQVIPEVESLYLEKLCESLGYFLEYIKPCLNQKQ